jgi:sec-independent protein translocase protein TatA
VRIMFGLGLPELAIITLVIVTFFFGGEKVSELARGLGRFAGEFKKGREEIENEIEKVEKEFKHEKREPKK